MNYEPHRHAVKAIICTVMATVSALAAAPEIPIQDVPRLAGVQSLSISDGNLQLTSLPPEHSWVPSLQIRTAGSITFLQGARLRSGDSIVAADMRHTRLTYSVISITQTEALLDVLEEHSSMGFGDFDRRSSYRVRIRPYTRTPDEIEAIVHPEPVKSSITLPALSN